MSKYDISVELLLNDLKKEILMTYKKMDEISMKLIHLLEQHGQAQKNTVVNLDPKVRHATVSKD